MPAIEQETLTLALITAAGLALRLPSWGNSLFGDELSTYFIVTGHGVGRILHILDGNSVDLTPPLFFVLAWFSERLGSSPELLRLVSLVAGTAAIPITYLVGLRTAGRRAALLGAGFVALCPFLVFYSTEARAYALVMALVLGSTLALLHAVDHAVDHGRWSWVAYAALSCAAVYTHYTAVFALAVQLVWALVRHPAARRPLLLASVAAVIGFLPWLPALTSNSRSFGTRVFGILEPFTPHAVAHDLAHWSIGHPFLALSTVPGTLGELAIGIGVVVAAAVVLVCAARRRERSLAKWVAGDALLPWLLAAATPIGLALYSVLGRSVWDLRNLIVSTPALALCTGALLAEVRRPLRPLLAGLVMAGLLVGALQLLSASRQRPDYAAAARFVLSHGSRQDPVAIVPAPTPGPLAALDAALAYAGDPGRPLLRIGSPALSAVLRARPYALLPATPAPQLARQAELAGGDGRLFVVAPGTASLRALLAGRPINARQTLGPVFGTGTTGRLFSSVFPPLSAFLRDVSRRFAPVQATILPGVLPISVYVLERRH